MFLIISSCIVGPSLVNAMHPLHKAVCDGNLPKLNRLLETGVSCDLQDGQGKTALHYAVMREDCMMIRVLLEHQANINISDNNGQAPLDLVQPSFYQKIVVMLQAWQQFRPENNQTSREFSAEQEQDYQMEQLMRTDQFIKQILKNAPTREYAVIPRSQLYKLCNVEPRISKKFYTIINELDPREKNDDPKPIINLCLKKLFNNWCLTVALGSLGLVLLAT